MSLVSHVITVYSKWEEVLQMAGAMFMRVEEVAEELGVSVPYASKLIRSMNWSLTMRFSYRNHRA